MKQFLLGCSLLCLVFYSCSKSDLSQPAERPPLVTQAGTPDGSAVSKKITSAGGSISSSDGRITVKIPAGALTEEETITVQPISKELEFGLGKAYRITPHTIHFNKPVTISFKYQEEEIRNTQPEFLAIGFQDTTGAWRAVHEPRLDKNTKTVEVLTRHFSDWGFFPTLYISPADARLEPGQSLELTVMGTVDPEDILLPNPDGSPMTDPFKVVDETVKGWQYSGAGSLSGNGAMAAYKAPPAVPSQNPEAVMAEIKYPRPGKFFLVANITILSDLHIDYLQVNETEVNVPGTQYESRLMIYGNFGNDPGVGKRSVKINGSPLNIVFWTPKLIVCDIYSQGPLSSGAVEVQSNSKKDTKTLNEWRVDLEYAKIESPGGALTRKFTLMLRLRGDANGFIKEGEQNMIPYSDLNKSSKALINISSGSFSNPVSLEACGTYTVKWDAVTDVEVARVPYSSHQGLGGRIEFTPAGVKLKIKFESPAVLRSTRTFVPCRGMTSTQVVMEPLFFQGFHEEEIFLRFSGSGTGASILADEMPTIPRTGVASGLYFDVTDLNPDAYYTTLKWKEEKPKYQ